MAVVYCLERFCVERIETTRKNGAQLMISGVRKPVNCLWVEVFTLGNYILRFKIQIKLNTVSDDVKLT